MNTPIPFNKPYLAGKELDYINQAHKNSMLAGDGPFSNRCHNWLESYTRSQKVLLTHSCTAALEMSALLLDIQPGDEVIMPSYTFVSTANAFVLRGGIPVFVDIREDTLNIDESLIEQAISSNTKAIIVVHYAGVSCEMNSIMSIAEKYNIPVIEDAAQGVMSKYKEIPLGAIGCLGCYSFHETKNIISGEGGALVINNPKLIQHSEIIREKGTDRTRFFRGEVDKYTWQMPGSSFLPGELIAAFLFAQLEKAEEITNQRLRSWKKYHDLLLPLSESGIIQRPYVPVECQHNGHMYYILLPEVVDRDQVLQKLHKMGIGAVFHYVPLHTSPAGKKYGRMSGELPVTERQAARLIRLPLWVGITSEQQMRVVQSLTDVVNDAVKGGGATLASD